MRKIAVFTEGESELLFIRKLLFITINNNKLSFECVSLGGQINNSVYWD